MYKFLLLSIFWSALSAPPLATENEQARYNQTILDKAKAACQLLSSSITKKSDRIRTTVRSVRMAYIPLITGLTLAGGGFMLKDFTTFGVGTAMTTASTLHILQRHQLNVIENKIDTIDKKMVGIDTKIDRNNQKINVLSQITYLHLLHSEMMEREIKKTHANTTQILENFAHLNKDIMGIKKAMKQLGKTSKMLPKPSDHDLQDIKNILAMLNTKSDQLLKDQQEILRKLNHPPKKL